MDNAVFVSIVPSATMPEKSPYRMANSLRLSVSYVKGQGIVLSCFPAEVAGPGIVSVLISAGERSLLEPLKRANLKRLNEWTDTVMEQIKTRAGAAWDLVGIACNRYHYKVKGDS